MLYDMAELVTELDELVSQAGWTEKPLPNLPNLRGTQAVRDLTSAGFPIKEAIIQALILACGALESRAWRNAVLVAFGLGGPTAGASKTDRYEAAAPFLNVAPRTYLRQRSEWGNRTGQQKALEDVAAVLMDVRSPRRDAIQADPEPSPLVAGWGWSVSEPPRSDFRNWEPASKKNQRYTDEQDGWHVVWSRSFLAIDEDDPRRQHYLWTALLRANVDGLITYPKPFHWTGTGDHESVNVDTPGCSWLGIRREEHKSRLFDAYHIFDLGRMYNRGDEVVLQFSETWFDMGYYFSPHLRVTTGSVGQEYAEVAVRLPPALEPYEVSEMIWDRKPGAAATCAQRVRAVDYETGTWYGIHVPQPLFGASYGLQWKSRVYDGT